MNRSRIGLFGAIPVMLLLLAGPFTILLIPKVYATSPTTSATSASSNDENISSTISEDTQMTQLRVGAGNTLIIKHGVTVDTKDLINYGTILNKGTLYFEKGTNNGGKINNFGTLGFIGFDGDFNNTNGGIISIENNGTLAFTKGGSFMPHDLVNERNSVIDNNGTVIGPRRLGMTIQNSGLMYRECAGVYDVPIIGSPVIDKCPMPVAHYTATIKAADLDGNSIPGVWMVVRSFIDNEIVAKGFTPLDFVGLSNTTYTITVSAYGGKIFDHWKEDGSNTSFTRTIRLTSNNTTFTAVYDLSKSFRGFTPLTFTNAQLGQANLTVLAKSIDSDKILHMWTIIEPFQVDEGTYFVTVHNFEDKVFDHWEDGSIIELRIVAPSQNPTITAFYKTG